MEQTSEQIFIGGMGAYHSYNDRREERKAVTDARLQDEILQAFILDKRELERAGFAKKKVSETRDQLVFYKNVPYRVSVWVSERLEDVFTVEQVLTFYS